MRTIGVLPLVAFAMVTACDKKANDTPADHSQDTAAVAGQMAMPGVQMIPAMHAHLDSIGAMSPADLAGAMAAHQDLASRTMDAMGSDMRSMGMQPDSSWSALADSLRLDLAELPALSGAALKARMDAHADRMRRMLAMHEDMMKI